MIDLYAITKHTVRFERRVKKLNLFFYLNMKQNCDNGFTIRVLMNKFCIG